MKTLSYSKKTKEDLVFQQIKKEVNEEFRKKNYSSYAPAYVWAKGALYFLLLFSSYFIVLQNYSFLFTSIAYLSIGFCLLLLSFNWAHDACHKSLSEKQWVNKLVYNSIINLQGAKASFWEIRHMKSHHLFPNVPGADADLDNNTLLMYAPGQAKTGIVKYQHIYAPFLYLFYTLHWLFVKDVKFALMKQHANLEMKFDIRGFISMLFIKVVYLFMMLALPMYLAGHNWHYPLISFFIMHLVISFFLVFTFVLTHYCEGVQHPEMNEVGEIEGSWSEHQVDVSIDFHADKTWAYWVFGGFNAHQAHHLFPAISHHHYQWITKIVKRNLLKNQMEYKEVTFFGGIGSHLRYLKQIANS
ncbi:MAG: fatty acid desaturase family protein [Flavobacteriales bacterium]